LSGTNLFLCDPILLIFFACFHLLHANGRLLLALRELSGGALLTRLDIGVRKVHVVACPRFMLALIPHTDNTDVCDMEALHIAHMLQVSQQTYFADEL
jgi:hypothetical protein